MGADVTPGIAAEEGNWAGNAPERFGSVSHEGLRAVGGLVALPGPVKSGRGWCGVGSVEQRSRTSAALEPHQRASTPRCRALQSQS